MNNRLTLPGASLRRWRKDSSSLHRHGDSYCHGNSKIWAQVFLLGNM